MPSLDFKLQRLQQTLSGETRIRVLLQYRNDLGKLKGLGFRVTAVAGDIAAGSISVNKLGELAQNENVIFVGGARYLKDEMDVSSVAINLIDPVSSVRTIPTLGSGAIIGIVDSGFDLTHPCFLNAEGQTRILAAWDQTNLDRRPGQHPTEFDYGLEFDQKAINRDVAEQKILLVKNQKGAGAHGTYVAGIAAGNGKPHGIFRGVAPEADLVLVSYTAGVEAGGSAYLLDAICYIRDIARASGRPVVINISQGDNLGSHDGTSLLDRAIDNLALEGDVLIITSAGNERDGPVSHHACGKVESRQDFILPFSLMTNAQQPVDGDTMELWYRHGDRFEVALKTPGGRLSQFVAGGDSAVIKFPAGNQAYVYSEMAHPLNYDNHIGIIFEKGEGWEAGRWELILRGKDLLRGDFDAWVDRPDGVTLIAFEGYQSNASTITMPGNGRRAIAVGGFVSRAEERGETGDLKGGISMGSSIGPTRDGRVKPDLTAPSSLIMSPRMRADDLPCSYDLMMGTSMAAPHVTGVCALLWTLGPKLTAGQIRSALCSSANNDTFTGAIPNTSWGFGKLDAGAAYKALLAFL